MRLFLASESPRRKVLLKQLISNFAVEAANVCEINDPLADPALVAQRNAALKADFVAARHPEAWVLGADTVVVLDGKCYGKPADLSEAADFLRKFSGRVHEVITAVALRRAVDGRKADFTAVTSVSFKVLSEDCIKKYLSLVPVLDKAGAYGIQEHGDMLVEKIDGELANVIGLPVAELKVFLEKLQII